MDPGFFAQYLINGLVQGITYALVAVGFTLFFGVLDVIKFSHGDVLMLGAFTALALFLGLDQLSTPAWLSLTIMLCLGVIAMALLGALLCKFLVLPLKESPPLNTLLITLMFGSVIREGVRLFFPNGSNPKPFPALLPETSINWGNLNLRLDSVILIFTGAMAIVLTHLFIQKTRMGLAIRAVAQDEETARLMGINFNKTVLMTFALGSGLAALSGISTGLYYQEINFSMGLMLGVIGFSAAVVGGLGSIYGAIVGGLLFAFLQTLGAIWFSVPAYKDVFAFTVIIMLMAWRPTGLLADRSAERV
ncbi:MAG: branched-chain amino acid ABC transporter permease [Betaproteobacteria bacterium]|jgi:branched-chain amino acid transport system permease protein|nr:branched-chain amino acid ABC transporter permease [Burkholderiales bacterium]MBT5950065.1 branched-chain amino acid ABC transporter permease [Betaproteobacteria bacterium]MBL6878959.1 branched-chain amino acid ABC transporter permease [Burkholderiales bacterium]MBT6411768.1 branched-chain amino acid ABC transporter permease [Betaproteobacteria bacterium]MCH1424013.1 branched-chain amino acid ABC transporter permease [Burkholderiales bacterium]